jgi:hypothetical protein
VHDDAVRVTDPFNPLHHVDEEAGELLCQRTAQVCSNVAL